VTPQRRDFHYPQQLTRTRPHTELLEDFRSGNTTLAGLPENDTEEETSKTGTADSVNESLSIPTLDLDTQDSILDSTTTSMTSVDSSLCSSRQSASEEQASNEKENTLPSCTPVESKIPHKKKRLGGTKGSSVKKQPLAILNKH